MQNSRPTYSFELPLKSTDGVQATSAKCTLKTPKLKIKNQVNKLVRDCTILQEESTALYRQTEPIANAIAAAVVAKDADAETAARAELADIMSRVESLAEQQDANAIERIALVTNISNADDGTQRTVADIDFDEVDPAVVEGALTFFATGQTK